MTTFRPFARHWSACVFCFWASPSALVITYETFAFLNAATSAGRSCVSQRTDDFGSGRSTQISPPAVLLAGFASAAVTATLIAASATTSKMTNFFTIVLLLVVCLDERRGDLTVLRGPVQCPRRESAARAVRTRSTPPS